MNMAEFRVYIVHEQAYQCYETFNRPTVKIGSLYSYWLRAGRLRVRSYSPSRVKNFLFSVSSRPALRPTQSPIQWVPRALSPTVKRQGREADHSTPTSAEVRKMWIYTSPPPYAFMV
jgi:hypothetical protein